jgi:hypothetical protein
MSGDETPALASGVPFVPSYGLPAKRVTALAGLTLARPAKPATRETRTMSAPNESRNVREGLRRMRNGKDTTASLETPWR